MNRLWASLIVCGAIGLVYGNSVDGGFHYDDFHSIVDNPHIRDLANIPYFFVDPQFFSADPAKAMYRPLLLVTYAFNYALGGYSGSGFHLVNILLHMGCALLVGQIGRRIGLERGAALGAALLFAVHPLASEPVNYISSRSEGLCAFFYLAAFWALGGAGRANYILGIVCFVLALMAKSVAISLPVVVFLWDRWGTGRRFNWRHGTLFGVAAAYVGLLWSTRFLAPAIAGAPRGIDVQVWTQIKALGYYLKLAVMPIGLNVEHQFSVSANPFSLAVLAPGLGLVLAGVVYWRSAIPRQRFWLAWPCIILAPTSLVPLNVLVNEHRLYLPLVGLVLAGVGLVGQRGRWLGIALCGVLALTTIQRNNIWSDELSLWTDAAAKSPQMPRAQVHLGIARRQQGDRLGAEAAFNRALATDSLHAAARVNLASLRLEAGAGLGFEGGRTFYLEAIEHCQRALAAEPDHREGLINLGNAYLFLGQLERAEPLYRRAIERYPHFAEAYFNLGQLKIRQQLWWQALGPLRRACVLEAQEPEYFYRRGEVLLLLGQQVFESPQGDSQALWREARQCFWTVKALAPRYPGLGKRLAQVEARLL